MLTQSQYSAMKGRLTRAINTGNNAAIVAVADAALRTFDSLGYPDDWHRWERAAADARFRAALNNERGF